MSDNKSYQRLLAVQAIYESSINKKIIDSSFDEMLSHIIENVDFKNKINALKIPLAKEIYFGVSTNLEKIDLILKNSLSDKTKAESFDKLLLSIFRCAIFEIAIKKQISKKIVISEYLLVSNHFFTDKESALLNGVLDNLR
tara:strand:- start:796 stop:1218 length:423 start_codon:yes stop_codon:yes gene_type:complete